MEVDYKVPKSTNLSEKYNSRNFFEKLDLLIFTKGIIHKNSYGGTIPVFWSLKTELAEILTINPLDQVKKIWVDDLGLN